MNSQTDIRFDPTTRDPREFEFGMFIADMPGYGGAHSFSWFGNDAEALAYLHDHLPSLYLEDDETTSVTQAIADAIQGATELRTLDLEPVNKALSGLCEIRWAGTFYDLEAGKKPFELEIQSDYRENIFGLERIDDDSCDLDYLAHHLEHYAG